METNISKLHIDSSGQADSVVHLGSKEDFTFHSTIDNKKSMKLLKTLSVFGGVLLTVGFFFFMATSMRISQSNSTKGFDFSKDEVSNFGEDFTMLASYDGSDYVNVFNTLLSKKYRFIILKRDTYNTNNIKLEAGPWEWLFSDFANAVDQYSEQVGFIFLGQPGKENLYMVVFNPKYQSRNAAQVLEGFRLPPEPKVLQKWGLPTVNYFVTRDKADLTLDNVIMTSKTTGVVSFLAEESPSMLATFDGSDYVNVFNTLLSKKYRFIILKRDTYNTNNIKLDAGPWEWLFSDFANAVDQYSEQVGFIFLGQKGKENLYMVVFNPKYQSRNAAQVLEGFRLPTEPKVLQKWGLPTVNYFVTRDKADLTLDNVIMKSKTTGIISFLEDDSLTILTTANHSYEHLNNEHLPQGIIRRERHHTLLLDDDSSPMLSTMDSLDQDLE